ncbi:putative toxin-antitoxin system toxin component, PIN family [Dyadobacter sp. CY326]|uniref:PIN domain-containing protein n=1 Tax=Dyadobacter sp. CY326 TaxID=2907300 RepID=UPI001F329783|nr:PIN domain-containing protein [Dyadobacter sp. CY326]MCE7064645.1 PIN domain-containing protein [Dyadobacter sp. CY326]
MKLFLDTNVLLDHALIRTTGEPFEAKFILSWALENEVPMYISPGSFHTFVYVLQKNGLKHDELRKKLTLYLRFLHVCQTDKTCLLHCLESNCKDFEDGFQYYTAVTAGCDYLLTNNVRDFSPSDTANIEVIKPSKFLTKVLKKKPGIDF